MQLFNFQVSSLYNSLSTSITHFYSLMNSGCTESKVDKFCYDAFLEVIGKQKNNFKISLESAVNLNNLEGIKNWIEESLFCDQFAKESDKNAALRKAFLYVVSKGKEEALDLFLKYSFAHEIALEEETVHLAARFGDVKVLEKLLGRRDQKIDRFFDLKFFISAIKSGNLANIKFFLYQNPHYIEEGEVEGSGIWALGFTPLSIAVKYKQIEAVKELLRQGAKLDSYGSVHPLMAAVWNQDIAFIKELIKFGVDLNREFTGPNRFSSSESALIFTAEKGNISFLNELVALGADVNFKLGDGTTALLAAAEKGHIHVIKRLIVLGADLHATKIIRLFMGEKILTLGGYTALMAAAGNGHLECMKELIALGLDVSQKQELLNLYDVHWMPRASKLDFKKGEFISLTLLMHAAVGGNIDCIKELIYAGANVNAIASAGGYFEYTALDFARVLKFPKNPDQVVETLLSFGADVNMRVESMGLGDSFFFRILRERTYIDYTVLRPVLKAGANVNQKLESNETPIMVAASKRDSVAIRELLNFKADVTAIKEDGETVLMSIIRFGLKELIEEIISLGCDINARNKDGDTAFDIAIRFGHIDYVKELLKFQPIIKQEDAEKLKFLIAVWDGDLKTIEELFSLGVNFTGEKGSATPLMIAAKNGNKEVLKILLEKGANPNIQKENGETALLIAVKEGQEECVEELLYFGADYNLKYQGKDVADIALDDKKLVSLALIKNAENKLQSIRFAVLASIFLPFVIAGLNAKYRNFQLIKAASEGDISILKHAIKWGASVEITDERGFSALRWSAFKGHLECVRELIAAGADVNQANNYGWTALMFAADNVHVECVRELIAGGADVNHANNNGRTGLMVAAQNGHVDCVKELIASGADVNYAMNDGKTALIFAAEIGNVDCVKGLIVGGADVNHKDNDGCTGLMFAAQEGNVDCVRELIAWGADVNHKDNDGETALILGAKYGNVECLRDLIAEGADVHHARNDGSTALISAAKYGNTECVRELIAAGVDINHKDYEGLTALMFAASNDRIECVECLIVYNADHTLTDENSLTALIHAAINGEIESLRFLIQSGSDVNYQTREGKTALMFAIENDKIEAVIELAESDVNWLLCDASGCTVFHYALKIGDHMLEVFKEQMAKSVDQEKLALEKGQTPLLNAIRLRKKEEIPLLLKEGASLFEAPDEYATALHFAAKRGAVSLIPIKFLTPDILEMRDCFGKTPLLVALEHKKPFDSLLKAGADFKAKDMYGRNPLMYAAQNGDKKAVESLMDMNIRGLEEEKILKMNETDNFGWTALHFAAFYGHTNVIRTLLNYGADLNAKNNDGVTPVTLAASRGSDLEFDTNRQSESEKNILGNKVLKEFISYDSSIIQIEESDGLAFILKEDEKITPSIKSFLGEGKFKKWQKNIERSKLFGDILVAFDSFYDDNFNCPIARMLPVDPVCCYPLRRGERLYFYERSALLQWNKQALQSNAVSFPLRSEIGSKREVERFIELPELKAFIRQMIKDCLNYLGNVEYLSNTQIQEKCAEFLKGKNITESVKKEIDNLNLIKKKG